MDGDPDGTVDGDPDGVLTEVAGEGDTPRAGDDALGRGFVGGEATGGADEPLKASPVPVPAATITNATMAAAPWRRR